MSARIFIMVGLVAVAFNVQGAAVLRGVVLVNQDGGSPMENVAVSATGGNPTNTGVDGQFTFKFPNKDPGETVLLTVRKEGYVVVNDVQLELTLPRHPDERLAKILVCKEGDREEWAGLFYRVKSREAVEETYKKKVKEAQNASPAELAKLGRERDQAKAAAEKPAEEFAKQKPGGGSELYRTAMRLLLEGNEDEALATLSDEKLRQLSEAAKQKEKAEAEKATEDAIQAWLLKAQLFTLQFRFEEAEKAYQQAIDVSPDSFKANFAFAGFNVHLNRYDKARRAAARCLELAKSKGNNSDVAQTLDGVAFLDRIQNRPEAARNGFEEALKIYRELAKKDPETYQRELAETLNSLASFDAEQNRPEAARKGHEEALKIRRELAKKNPEKYQEDVAMTLGSLAILDLIQNWLEAARREFEEALKIYRELAKKNPEKYQPLVASTLSNLAILDGKQNRPEAARKGGQEALKIYRELAQKNPETFQQDVATTLNNLGFSDMDQNRPKAARMELEEALKISRELAKKDPETYQRDVASTLSNLAILDSNQNRLEAAREGEQEALKIYRELAQKNPETFQWKVATTLHDLARLDFQQNRLEAARQGFEESLKILREPAKKNPEKYQPLVAIILKNLAILDKKQNRPEAARKRFEEALGIYEQLEAGNPNRFQSDVAEVQRWLRTLNR
jgi:hypothetical protein